jgi:hypothetical protein
MRLSPCLNPLSFLIGVVITLFVFMQKNDFITLKIFPVIPISHNLKYIASLQTESNALQKSTKHTNVVFFNLCIKYLFNSVFKINI